MKLPTYLKLKRGAYFYQRRVPGDVSHLEPFSSMPTVFEVSLRTSDLNEALRLLADKNEWFDATLAAVRSGQPVEPVAKPKVALPNKAPAPEPDDQWIAYQARRHYDEITTTTYDLYRQSRSGSPQGRDLWEEWQETELADLNSSLKGEARETPADPDLIQVARLTLSNRDLALVRRQALRIFADAGITPPLAPMKSVADWRRRHPIETTPAFEGLCEALIDARREAAKALEEFFDSGSRDHQPRAKVLLDAPETLEPPGTYDLAEIAGRTIRAAHSKSEEWRFRLRRCVELWQVLGLPMDVRKIRRSHVVDYVEQLLRSPANMQQRLPGLALPEAIKVAQDRNLPKLSPFSIKDAYLAPLKKIFTYAADRELIAKSPAYGVNVDGAKNKRKGRSTHFHVDELNKLFQLPQFTGCKSPQALFVPGEVLLDDHYFWAPLIALFTGARTSEIAQLLIEEVILTGTPHFLFQEDDERGIKTDAGRRVTPIHPALFEIGLREYVSRRVAAGDLRLFPDWHPPASGKYADSSSQRHFKRNVIPRISVRKSPNPTFHSFRNTLKSAMGDCGVPVQHQNAMAGHEQVGMDATYLTGLPLEALAESMNRTRFRNLEIEHLYGTRK